MKDFEIDGVKIEWIGHATFRIRYRDLVIYVDPYIMDENPEPADLVLITHDHFDHCDREALEKVLRGDTYVIANVSCKGKVPANVYVRPGDVVEWKGIGIEAVPAYNVAKQFHPKEKQYTGYLIKLGRVTVYHPGDTDLIPEMEKLKGRVTVALLPIGGTYTMDEKDAAEAVRVIQPEYVIPMHYNFLPGLEKDPKDFEKLVGDASKVIILEPLGKPRQ